MTLLAHPPEQRDMSLSSLSCEAALASILMDTPVLDTDNLAAAASSFKTLLGSADVRGLANESLLTEAERSLLNEWLRRLADRST